jgi:hypothetical protein
MVTVEDEIVAGMDGQRGVERGDLAAERRRRAALIAFMSTGMPFPPSTALLVAALAPCCAVCGPASGWCMVLLPGNQLGAALVRVLRLSLYPGAAASRVRGW